MKKLITYFMAAAVVFSVSLTPASAASMEIYGETKMNLWDLYLTENNQERPDVISTATVDAVSQATYNPYDNKPVAIETAVDYGLIADSIILEQYGIKNEMVDRILSIWRDGYRIRDLGTTSSETNPLTRNIVKYSSDNGTPYYLSYQAVKEAMSDQKGFSWDTFAQQAAQEKSVSPPYKVKYLLDNGDFGKRTQIGSKTGLIPPDLTLDETFSSKAENAGRFIKLNFEGNTEWAKAVYAIRVNTSGLLQGNMTLGSYSDHNGDTSFITGQEAADKSQILIRLSQKFNLGENKLTFMAYGYQDAEFTVNLDGAQSAYPWIVTFQAVNSSNSDETLTPQSTVNQGDTLRIDAVGSNFSGRFDGIYIDGKPLPKEDASQSAHSVYYEYGSGGKTLSVYTDALAAGLHELHLMKHGYNDQRYFFTVGSDGVLEAPSTKVRGEQLSGSSETGGSLRGTPVVLQSDDVNLKKWHDSIRKILYINDVTGKVNEIGIGASTTAVDESEKTVSIHAGSMGYWNSTGNFTLVIRATGFKEVKIPVKRVNAMPDGSGISYRNTDGAVVVVSNYSYLASDNLQTVSINGKDFPAGSFETALSYSGTSTLTIPSEYFDPGATAEVVVKTKNYSDLKAQLAIPENHAKRLPAPSALAVQARVTKGASLILNFTEDPVWRASIQKVSLRNSSNTDSDYKSKSNGNEAGKLTVGPVSLNKGSYTLIVTATGYQDLRLPFEVVDPVPGAVSYELQPDGSVLVSVAGGSSYVGAVITSLDGEIVPEKRISKNSAAIILAKECFSEKRDYSLKLQASGYADYSLLISTDVAEPPTIAVSGQIDTASQKVSVAFEENENWRGALTGAELVSNSGTVTNLTISDKSTPGLVVVSVTGSLYTGDYKIKLSAEGYRKAVVPVKILKPVPSGVSYDLLLVDGIAETNIKLQNYSYASSITKIKAGETVLQKGEDFTVNTSDYLVVIPGELSSDPVEVVLYADGYPDKSITMTGRLQPPAVTLPDQIARGAEFTAASEDGTWAAAVSSITVGTKSFGSEKLIKEGGKVSVAASDMKNCSAGKGQAIKINAEGYRTLVVKDLMVYDKPSSVFSQVAEWNDGSLSIELKDSATSYSSYSVDKVYLDDMAATSFTKPAYPDYKLRLPAENFAELGGKTILIRITGSNSNLPELLIQVTVPQ